MIDDYDDGDNVDGGERDRNYADKKVIKILLNQQRVWWPWCRAKSGRWCAKGVYASRYHLQMRTTLNPTIN